MTKLSQQDLKDYIGSGVAVESWGDEMFALAEPIAAAAILELGYVEPEEDPEVFENETEGPVEAMMRMGLTNDVLVFMDDDKLDKVEEVALRIFKEKYPGVA